MSDKLPLPLLSPWCCILTYTYTCAQRHTVARKHSLSHGPHLFLGRAKAQGDEGREEEVEEHGAGDRDRDERRTRPPRGRQTRKGVFVMCDV